MRDVFVYRAVDINSNPSDKEGWFEIERLDGSHKPAFDVFCEAALTVVSLSLRVFSGE